MTVEMQAIGSVRLYKNREAAAACPAYRRLLTWCQSHGYPAEIQRRVYDNLPDNSALDSMDDDPTLPPQTYYELYAAIPAGVTAPHNDDFQTMRNHGSCPNESAALDEIVAARLRQSAADASRKQQRIAELLDMIPDLVARDGHAVTGTDLADVMYNRGGEWQELRHLLLSSTRPSLDPVRDRLRQCQ